MGCGKGVRSTDTQRCQERLWASRLRLVPVTLRRSLSATALSDPSTPRTPRPPDAADGPRGAGADVSASLFGVRILRLGANRPTATWEEKTRWMCARLSQQALARRRACRRLHAAPPWRSSVGHSLARLQAATGGHTGPLLAAGASR